MAFVEFVEFVEVVTAVAAVEAAVVLLLPNAKAALEKVMKDETSYLVLFYTQKASHSPISRS